MEQSTTSTVIEPEADAPKPVTTTTPADFSSANLWQRMHAISPFGSNVALTTGANILLCLVALVTGPICARLLGPAGRGELAAIQNLYWLAAALSMLGLPEATLYFTARKKENGRRILASSFCLVIIAFPIFLAAFFWFVPKLLAAQSATVIQTARLCLLGLPLYALIVIPVYSLRGNNDLVRWNLMRILPGVGWLLLLLLLPLFVHPTSQLIAWGYLGMLSLLLVPTFIMLHRRVPGAFTPDPSSWPVMLKYGLPLAGATIPTVLNLRLDQMLMGALLPSRSLGLYVVAVAWSGAVTPLISAVGTVLFPRIASAAPEKRNELLSQGLRLGVATAVPVALLVAALTPLGIPLLFGRAFESSSLAALILVFGTSIAGLNLVLEEGLRGLGRTRDIFWGESLGLIVTAGGLVVLLKPFGILGAAIASLLAYSATFVVLALRTKSATNLFAQDLFLPRLTEVNQAWHQMMRLGGKEMATLACNSDD
jgi:O-antigen/teichoic acid export membrane protein